MSKDSYGFISLDIFHYLVDYHYKRFVCNELLERRFVDDLRYGFVADIFEIFFDCSRSEYVARDKVYDSFGV